MPLELAFPLCDTGIRTKSSRRSLTPKWRGCIVSIVLRGHCLVGRVLQAKRLESEGSIAAPRLAIQSPIPLSTGISIVQLS
jgi:hypothetical protein